MNHEWYNFPFVANPLLLKIDFRELGVLPGTSSGSVCFQKKNFKKSSIKDKPSISTYVFAPRESIPMIRFTSKGTCDSVKVVQMLLFTEFGASAIFDCLEHFHWIMLCLRSNEPLIVVYVGIDTIIKSIMKCFLYLV